MGENPHHNNVRRPTALCQQVTWQWRDAHLWSVWLEGRISWCVRLQPCKKPSVRRRASISGSSSSPAHPVRAKRPCYKPWRRRTAFLCVNINLELSKRMLELTRTQRARQVERLFKDVIAAAPGDVVLLDNLEILFDPSLEVEPLRLLQVVSRNRTLVAAWNGQFRDGTLTYAEPGHPEYRQFKHVEAILVTTVRLTRSEGDRFAMKYRQLVNFEPIETVIQLEQADSLRDRPAARPDVRDSRTDGRAADATWSSPTCSSRRQPTTRASCIVGNYGTGKSHLLSLISGLAEHADMAKVVQDKDVAEASKAIAGKFKVDPAGNPGDEEEPAEHHLRQARRLPGRRKGCPSPSRPTSRWTATRTTCPR